MEQNPVTFCIVTPSYNHDEFIRAAIESVLQQQTPGIRIDYQVMDGGSTDGTVNILKRYDGRLHWVSRKDGGQSDAVNQGIARGRGEIIGWLNSDDLYVPGALTAVADYFRVHPDVMLVYGDAEFVDRQGRVISRCAHIEPFNAHRLLHYNDFIVQPAAFFRREAFEAVRGLDPSLKYGMDYDLWLKMAGRFKVAYLPRVLAQYRWSGENKTAAGGWERLREIEQMARRHGAAGLPAYVGMEAVRLHLAEAAGALKQGRLLCGAGHVMRSIGRTLVSPRIFWSLFSPRTWRVIQTRLALSRAK